MKKEIICLILLFGVVFTLETQSSKSTQNPVITKLDSLIGNLAQENSENEDLSIDQLKECEAEIKFRRKEVNVASSAYVLSDDQRVDCDNALDDAVDEYNVLKRYVNDGKAKIKALKDQRQQRKKQYETRAREHQDTLESILESYDIIDKFNNAKGGFIQISDEVNRMFIKALKNKYAHHLSGVVTALAEIMTDGGPNEVPFETINKLIILFKALETKVKASLSLLTREDEKDDDETDKSITNLSSHIEKIRSSLNETTVYISEMKRCVNIETEVSKAAYQKKMRNEKILAETIKMCDTFNKKYKITRITYQKQLKLLRELKEVVLNSISDYNQGKYSVNLSEMDSITNTINFIEKKSNLVQLQKKSKRKMFTEGKTMEKLENGFFNAPSTDKPLKIETEEEIEKKRQQAIKEAEENMDPDELEFRQGVISDEKNEETSLDSEEANNKTDSKKLKNKKSSSLKKNNLKNNNKSKNNLTSSKNAKKSSLKNNLTSSKNTSNNSLKNNLTTVKNTSNNSLKNNLTSEKNTSNNSLKNNLTTSKNTSNNSLKNNLTSEKNTSNNSLKNNLTSSKNTSNNSLKNNLTSEKNQSNNSLKNNLTTAKNTSNNSLKNNLTSEKNTSNNSLKNNLSSEKNTSNKSLKNNKTSEKELKSDKLDKSKDSTKKLKSSSEIKKESSSKLKPSKKNSKNEDEAKILPDSEKKIKDDINSKPAKNMKKKNDNPPLTKNLRKKK